MFQENHLIVLTDFPEYGYSFANQLNHTQMLKWDFVLEIIHGSHIYVGDFNIGNIIFVPIFSRAKLISMVR
jgi:hypothetical protein